MPCCGENCREVESAERLLAIDDLWEMLEAHSDSLDSPTPMAESVESASGLSGGLSSDSLYAVHLLLQFAV